MRGFAVKESRVVTYIRLETDFMYPAVIIDAFSFEQAREANHDIRRSCST